MTIPLNKTDNLESLEFEIQCENPNCRSGSPAEFDYFTKHMNLDLGVGHVASVFLCDKCYADGTITADKYIEAKARCSTCNKMWEKGDYMGSKIR